MTMHNPTPDKMQVHYKNSNSCKTIQKVRTLFLEGNKLTALSINQICQTNDARKIISDLRNKEGWNIQDMRLNDGRKLYWLVENVRQLSFLK